MILNEEFLRFLPKDTQDILLKDWGTLTLEAQKLIIWELEKTSQYEQEALLKALENNPDFWLLFQEKLKQIKSSYVHQIEQEEQEEEWLPLLP